ncbi:MAG: PIG-L family deacetylase, partial [Chloroflexi bacterium]|nr:PIG-L family deacetylase [Chloroflexota bacterium]
MKRVLVIAAHPDDEVLGCGGVIARHNDRGDLVQVLIVTRGDSQLFPPEQVATLHRELHAAHQVLGVSEAHFLDFPAPRLDSLPGYKVAEAIRQVIFSFRPEIIYLPH